MKPDKGKKTLVMDGSSGVLAFTGISVLGEISFDAMMRFDFQRRITYWNAAAEHRLSTIDHQLSLFGGQMDIRSQPGEGTLITITIPYP